MRLDYHLLDVFTDRQFGGNPLAVFPQPPTDLSPSPHAADRPRVESVGNSLLSSPPADPGPQLPPAHFHAGSPSCRWRAIPPSARHTRWRIWGASARCKRKRSWSSNWAWGRSAVTDSRRPARQTDRSLDAAANSPIRRHLPRPARHRRDALPRRKRSTRNDAPLQVLSSGLPFPLRAGRHAGGDGQNPAARKTAGRRCWRAAKPKTSS